MTVGIVGLGLIGGSAAKAFRTEGHTVYGTDRDRAIADFAVLDGAIDAVLTDDLLASCELLLLCVYPEGVLDFLREKGAKIAKSALIIDFAGVKGVICPQAFALAEEYGFTFVGGHPMAGSHRSGYAAARENLFSGASMVAVPPRFDDPSLFEWVKCSLAPLGFARTTFCTAEEHDRMIAYTSQLAHVVSSAYVRSDSSEAHRGFSAGSWKDLTRVAYLNEHMWSTLFLANRDALLCELDTLIAHLAEYRESIAEGDRERLTAILREGREMKSRADRSKVIGNSEK